LHDDDKKIAKKLAEKSGGKYTEQQIEDQMRMMGVTADGTYVSGAPDTLVGNQAPTDSGATWMYAGTTADGKPVLTQGTVPVDPQLQQYISMYGGSASPGQVPTGYKYDAPPSSGSGLNLPQVTGPFTQFNNDDANFMRNTTADAASMISTNAGRLGSAAAVAGSVPSPYAPGLQAVAFGSTVVGVGADALAQLVKPNVGQYATSGVSNIIVNGVSDKYPELGPGLNELSNWFSDSPYGSKIHNGVNSYWNNFVNYWSGKR